MTDEPDPLERATALARAEPVESQDWAALTGAVMRRIRGAVRPGRPVRVPLPDDRGSRTYVNERVVEAALRTALDQLDGLAPSAIRMVVAGEVCTAVEIELAARYGSDLQLLGQLVRERAGAVLHGVLLGDADAVDVRVEFVDVTLEDPRR